MASLSFDIYQEFLSTSDAQLETPASFDVKTGVRQGCVMSSILFIIDIDSIINNTTSDIPRGIRLGTFATLEDLTFPPLSPLPRQDQQTPQVRRKHWTKDKHKKSEILTLNVNNPTAIKVEDHILPRTNTFTFLSSKVTTCGGEETDIKQK